MIIFDLDGTLALIEHRRHFIEGKDKNWNAFFEACDQDEPNWPVIAVLQALRERHPYIEIWSGRSDLVLAKTLNWLAAHNIPIRLPPADDQERLARKLADPSCRVTLRMRQEGDFTPDDELKMQWLEEVTVEGKLVEFVFDDRQKVVDMWRAKGIVCMQVAPGDF